MTQDNFGGILHAKSNSWIAQCPNFSTSVKCTLSFQPLHCFYIIPKQASEEHANEIALRTNICPRNHNAAQRGSIFAHPSEPERISQVLLARRRIYHFSPNLNVLVGSKAIIKQVFSTSENLRRQLGTRCHSWCEQWLIAVEGLNQLELAF